MAREGKQYKKVHVRDSTSIVQGLNISGVVRGGDFQIGNNKSVQVNYIGDDNNLVISQEKKADSSSYDDWDSFLDYLSEHSKLDSQKLTRSTYEPALRELFDFSAQKNRSFDKVSGAFEYLANNSQDLAVSLFDWFVGNPKISSAHKREIKEYMRYILKSANRKFF